MLEPQALLVTLVIQEFKVLQDPRDSWATKGREDKKEILVTLEYRDPRE